MQQETSSHTERHTCIKKKKKKKYRLHPQFFFESEFFSTTLNLFVEPCINYEEEYFKIKRELSLLNIKK